MIKAITKSGESVTVYAATMAEFNQAYDRLLREGAKIKFSRTP